MLINEETQEKLNLLIQKFFQLNRTWDNFLGFSNVEWSLSNFNKIFHAGLAHLYPLLADLVSDIELKYNVVPKYYETERDTRTYSTMLDFFNTNINEHIETYELIKDAINVATINGDLNVECELKHLLKIFNSFMEQAILLRDKAQIYGEDNKYIFDSFADQFYILDLQCNMLNNKDED